MVNSKYKELLTFISDLQEGEDKLPRTEIAEEHERLKKEIRAAYADRKISGAQAGRLLRELP